MVGPVELDIAAAGLIGYEVCKSAENDNYEKDYGSGICIKLE